MTASHDERNLFDGTRSSAVTPGCSPRQSARPKKQAAGARRSSAAYGPGRLRYREVELPRAPETPGSKPLKLWVVHVLEAPPAGPRLEWFLLTTREIASREQAQEFCAGTACAGASRTGIASSRAAAASRPCTQDRRTTQTRHRHQPRHRMAHHADDAAGSQCPELPADILFSDLEIEVLNAYPIPRLGPPS